MIRHALLALALVALNVSPVFMDQPQALAQSSPHPLPGGYVAAEVDDPGVQQAATAAAKALASRAWLGKPVKLGAIAEAERQVVAGTNFRLTFPLTYANVTRQAQAVVFRSLRGAYQLMAIELAPQGEPLVGAPSPTDLPGGYVVQPVRLDLVRQAANDALKLLQSPEWLGQPVRLVSIQQAATQVVSGTNTYMAMTVQVGSVRRPVGVVLYENLQRGKSLSWLELRAPAGR
jgi:hypothetical protein